MTVAPAVWWLAAALLLGGIELAVPGLFLVFFAIAAAITALLAAVVPGFGIEGQLAAFAVWSAVATALGWRWYRADPVASADPMLNDRGARLVGQIVHVTDPISGGHGRVRVGDSEWLATGADAGAGARLRITACDGGVLSVEPAEA